MFTTIHPSFDAFTLDAFSEINFHSCSTLQDSSWNFGRMICVLHCLEDFMELCMILNAHETPFLLQTHYTQQFIEAHFLIYPKGTTCIDVHP
jgi:hypothetical protein